MISSLDTARPLADSQDWPLIRVASSWTHGREELHPRRIDNPETPEDYRTGIQPSSTMKATNPRAARTLYSRVHFSGNAKD